MTVFNYTNIQSIIIEIVSCSSVVTLLLSLFISILLIDNSRKDKFEIIKSGPIEGPEVVWQYQTANEGPWVVECWMDGHGTRCDLSMPVNIRLTTSLSKDQFVPAEVALTATATVTNNDDNSTTTALHTNLIAKLNVRSFLKTFLLPVIGKLKTCRHEEQSRGGKFPTCRDVTAS